MVIPTPIIAMEAKGSGNIIRNQPPRPSWHPWATVTVTAAAMDRRNKPEARRGRDRRRSVVFIWSEAVTQRVNS